MQHQKRYSNLSKRQVFRRLAVQWEANLRHCQYSSSQFTNELQSASSISNITQEENEEKNSSTRVNNKSEETCNFEENVIDMENIQMDHTHLIQDATLNRLYNETEADSKKLQDVPLEEFIQNDTFDFIQELKSFAIHSEIKHVHLNFLLNLLKKAGFDNLPTDSRTLLETPRISDAITPCPPGDYLHYGLKKAIEKQLRDSTHIEETSLMFDLNIDGLPITKSSSTSLWPILGKFVHTSFNTPFIIGVYCGNKKPSSVDVYLTPFINEYKQLQEEGIFIDGIRYNVTLRCIVCDSPARSYVKCTKQFNGYFSCDKCIDEGEYRDRMVFLSESASLRTDDTFRRRTNEEHHIGTSPFELLSIDMVKQFPLDSLHVVYLGVMKSLLTSWLNNHRNPRFTSRAIQKLSDMIVIAAQWVPEDFNRKPRGLQELCRWKGTEFRMFLLYLGPIILQHFLPEEYLIHFNSLNCAMRILCDSRDSYRNNAYAKELLIYFVQQFKILYGEQYVTSNIHYLIHLNEDVKLYGPIDSYSTFDFENYMQVLKRLMRKHANTLQQIHRRLMEKHNNQHLQNKNMKIPKYPVIRGPIVSELPYDCHSEHRKIQFCTFQLSNKRPDNCCFMTDGNIVVIKHIALLKRDIVVLGQKYEQKCDILYYPCPSSYLNIYKVDKFSSLLLWPAQCINRKGLLITVENTTYAMPLLQD